LLLLLSLPHIYPAPLAPGKYGKPSHSQRDLCQKVSGTLPAHIPLSRHNLPRTPPCGPDEHARANFSRKRKYISLHARLNRYVWMSAFDRSSILEKDGEARLTYYLNFTWTSELVYIAGYADNNGSTRLSWQTIPSAAAG
jgi:hypothetical protein